MINALLKYVEQISGVLAICGAVVVVIVAIILTELNRICHFHIKSAEITWASFVAGLAAAGLVSIVYGVTLSGIPGIGASAGNRDNRLAANAIFFGIFMVSVAMLGFFVPATS